MNKHQMKTDVQRSTTNKMSNLIKSSNDLSNNIPIKKIKLETNETPTNLLKPVVSPIDSIVGNHPTTIVSGIVDTYFAAKMADRVSCDICHKVRFEKRTNSSKQKRCQYNSSKCVINIFSKLIN